MSTIAVSLVNQKVQVSDPSLKVKFGQNPTIAWEASEGDGLAIAFIGFERQVGQGSPLTIPTRQSSKRWTAVDNNQNASGQDDVFRYQIWASAGGVMYSSDPEIVNEPNSKPDPKW